MTETMRAVVLTVVAAGVGALLGVGGRLLLRRLRRGVAVRPPWCEIAVGGLTAVVGARATAGHLTPTWAPVPVALGWLAVLLTATDLARRRLPDALTLPAYPGVAALLGVAAWGGAGPGLVGRALAGAAVFGCAHALVHLAAPSAMGAGDVKLAGVLGAVLAAVDWAALLVAAFGANLLTALLGLLTPARCRDGPASSPGARAVPHGPGLLAATWLVAAFLGEAVFAGDRTSPW